MEHLNDLRVLDANLAALGTIPTLTHLTVTGLTSVIDVSCLHVACPNLVSLSSVGAKLVQSERGRNTNQSKRHLSLTSLSLRDTLGRAWVDLVQCSPHIAWLSIFNVVISDSDVASIVAANSLSKLEGLR